MRIPVFARGANPRIDRPNQRKSLNYGLEEVAAGRADWIDPSDPLQGIWCRAILYGQKVTPAYPEQLSQLSLRSALPPLEVHGATFDDPVTNSAIRQDRACLIVRAQAFARYALAASV